MAENANQSSGQICWYEVPVTSVSRAFAFYSSVLGWNCSDLEGTPSPGAYAKSVHMFNKGNLNGAFLLMPHENGVANVTDLGPPEQNVPVTTFMVESIEETIKKVEAAGGKVHVSVNSYIGCPLCEACSWRNLAD